VAVAKALHDHEDHGEDHREPEAEVRALLRDELAQLPAVGRRGGGAFEAGSAEGLGVRCADRAHDVAPAESAPTAASSGARGGDAPLPSSVSLKKRSSSVASSGVSERMPTPARPSASESAPTWGSSAWKATPFSESTGDSIPRSASA